jgi:pheromone a factor receptor
VVLTYLVTEKLITVPALTIRAFSKRRLQFKQLLSANNNLNTSRYLRLMCLAGVELLCGVPLSSWVLYLQIKGGLYPWKGWADTHSHFSRVDQVPSLLWRSTTLSTVANELGRWIMVICAFIFFAFFGFADEARKNYRNAFCSVAKRVGYSTGTMTSSAAYVLVIDLFLLLSEHEFLPVRSLGLRI